MVLNRTQQPQVGRFRPECWWRGKVGYLVALAGLAVPFSVFGLIDAFIFRKSMGVTIFAIIWFFLGPHENFY